MPRARDRVVNPPNLKLSVALAIVKTRCGIIIYVRNDQLGARPRGACMPNHFRGPITAAVLALAACGGDGGSGPSPSGQANCDAPATVTLAPGQHAVVGLAASAGCVRLPSPGGSAASYFFALVAGSGTVTQSGVSGPFALRIGDPGSVAPATASLAGPAASPILLETPEDAWPLRFHQALRERERELSAEPGNRLPELTAGPAMAPPDVGSEKTFKVCTNLTCTQFTDVTAVARVVDQKVAVYLDKVVPTFDTLTQADLVELARTFNTYHYPINSNAFGAESDKDANGIVAILLTDAVNALTPDCTNGRILGFFWGGDLLDVTGSNKGEVFYAMVPAPATSNCTAARRKETLDRLKATLIHEFQHMISFNQHALLRNGQSEVTWLNEALSHFAEELAGRLIPNSECVGFSSCRSQYASGDIINAYDYLAETEANFMIMPGSSSGALKERGAVYLFIRWLADQFGTDSLGTNTTRALVQTSQVGAANVTAATGQDFPTLVAEWQLAVYIDDLAGFTPASARLTYLSYGYRAIFQNNCCTAGAPFDRAFPMEPVQITTASFPYIRTGTLRGGSGRHFQLTLSAGSGGADLLVSRSANGPQVDAALQARLAIVRLQ